MRKILYIWPGLTGYMGDCWRELGKHAQVKVLVDGVGLGDGFTDEVMAGLDWERVSEADVLEKIAAFSPDVIVVVGWHRAIPRHVAFAKELESVPKVLVMDMPWRWSIRCFAARFALRRYIRRFRGAFVHGEPSARYARWLGFRPDQIHRHCICGVNMGKFGGLEVPKFGSLDETSKPLNLQASKLLNLQASSFLFVGRQAKEKGIETLRKAYEIYRKNGGTWTLTLPDWIDSKDVPRMMREHACLVLPSLWEPWGVVVAEAKAAGMKIIVSDRVGARLDIPCDEVVKAGDAKELAAAMKRVEVSKFGGLEDSKFGGLEYFSCETWAKRVLDICKELT